MLSRAQTLDLNVGESPQATYDIGIADNENPINGNVYLNIPLLDYPQRGGRLDLSFKLYFNAKQWYVTDFVYPYDNTNGHHPQRAAQGVQPDGSPTPSALGAYVARSQYLDFGTDFQYGYESQGSGYSQWAISGTFTGSFVREPNGAKHYLSDSAVRNCQQRGAGNCPVVVGFTDNTYPSSDKTGFTYAAAADNTLAALGPDGVRYTTDLSTGLETITDTNGNAITEDANGWTDTIRGRIPGSKSDPGTGTGGVSPDSALDTGEPTPGVPSDGSAVCTKPGPARLWEVPSVGGGTAKYYLCYSLFTFQTAFN